MTCLAILLLLLFMGSHFRCPVAGRKKRKRPREPERVQSVRLSDWAEKWAICKHGQEALLIGGGAFSHYLIL